MIKDSSSRQQERREGEGGGRAMQETNKEKNRGKVQSEKFGQSKEYKQRNQQS